MKDPGKKQSGDWEVEYPDYYSENHDEPMKAWRTGQGETDETDNERIIRQISNGSVLDDDSLADGSRFMRLFANENPRAKDLNDAESLKSWEGERPAIARSDDDNVISYTPTYLPAVADEKINSGSLYYIPDVPQEDLTSDHLQETIDQPEKSVLVDVAGSPSENPIDSYADLTHLFTTDSVLDAQLEAERVPGELGLNVPHFYVNLSNKSESLVKPEEVEVLYPVESHIKVPVESSTSAPHFFRKVPGALNLYVADRRNGGPVIAPASEYVYPVVSMSQPLRKVNEHASVISQSVPDRPIEHILLPDREKVLNPYESDMVGDYSADDQKQMIGKDHNVEEEAARILHERHESKIKEGSASGKVTHDDRSSTTTAKVTTTEGANGQRANVSAMLNETKEVANQILEKIMDELEEIRSDRPEKIEQIEGNY